MIIGFLIGLNYHIFALAMKNKSMERFKKCKDNQQQIFVIHQTDHSNTKIVKLGRSPQCNRSIAKSATEI